MVHVILIADGTREHVCRLGTQTLDGHQPTTDSSRTWTSSPCLLIGFEAHFPVSSSQHFKLWYMSSLIACGTREHVCRLGTQTLDGHQPTTHSSRTWTSSPCLPIGFEAHFPLSSSQHFKLQYIQYISSFISDGTREHVCRLATQTLDGHQPTTHSLRTWTSSPCLLIGFEAHFPLSSSQHFKLRYIQYISSFISDGTREHVCRLATQTLDGHQPTTHSSRTWTSSSCLLIGFEAHFPVSSSQHFKLQYIQYMSSFISDGTREHVCRLATQTLDGHQPTTHSLRTWTSSPCLLIGFEAHFPLSSSQHFKLRYIQYISSFISVVLVNMSVGWLPRRSMDTNQQQIRLRTLTSSPCLPSDLRHTSHFPHHSTSNFGTFSTSSFISDGTREHVCRLATQTLDGHQPTTHSSRTWTSSPCLLIGFEAHFPLSSSQHFKL